MHRAALSLLLAGTTALAAACGGGRDNAPATETASPSRTSAVPGASPWTAATSPSATPTPPAQADAKLVVYADQVSTVMAQNRAWPVVEIRTWDRTARRQVSVFTVGAAGEFYTGALLAPGRRLIVNLERRIFIGALDGTSQRELFNGGDRAVASSVALSPDGKTLAIGVEPRSFNVTAEPEHSYLLFVDIATAKETTRITRGVFAAAGFRGSPRAVAWWADGTAVEVSDITHSGGGGVNGVASLDGRVQRYEARRQLITPGGVLLVFSAGTEVVACGVGDRSAPTAIDIRVPGGQRAIESIRVEASTIFAVDASPDGKEVLLEAQPLRSAGGTTCADFDAAPAVYAWSVAGELQLVADRAKLLALWNGGRALTLTCAGTERTVSGRAPIACGATLNPPEGTLKLNGDAMGQVRSAEIVAIE